jgi:hypothetical protein
MKKIALFIPALLMVGCAGPSNPSRNAMVVFKQTAAPVEGKKYVYTVSPAVPLSQIYNAQQAQQIVEDFRAAYIKLGAPRINISVNLPQGTFEVPQLPTVGVGGTPQIDPATGLPIDPNAPAPGTAAPAIDPAPGLPVLANGTAPAPATEAPAKPRLSPRKRVKKLFGR